MEEIAWLTIIQYFKNPKITVYYKIVYDFTEEKISIAGESFNSEMNWNSLYKIVELKEWIILYHNRQAANFIPKTGIGENLTELRNLIQSKKDLRSKLRKD